MANQEHLDKLEQGVETWNQWRKQHKEVRPDLSGANLRGTSLFRANLSSADLSDTNLSGADLSEADLSDQDLSNKDLSGANLSGANLRGTYLGSTDLSGANLSRANLSDTDLRRADLSNSKLIGVNLSGANLSGQDLSNKDLIGANLSGANLSGACIRGANLFRAELRGTNLSETDLRGADLSGTHLFSAYFSRADLSGQDLSNKDLSGVNFFDAILSDTNLRGANLSKANLSSQDLSNKDLSRANLSGANLSRTLLLGTNFTEAILTDCTIYGIASWNVQLKNAIQKNLIITQEDEATITVDNLKIAQFIYLLLNNEEIRDVIDTLTTKSVLILGRFTPQRKAILDALRDALRKKDYVPIMFDFDPPHNRDLTETVTTLARMARFIIADITDAKSIPQELAFIIPDLPSVPVQPLILNSQHEYSMFEHFTRFPWVLPVYYYTDQASLLQSLKEKVIEPAEQKAKELEKR